MTDEKIQRINELYKKSKTVGLTDAEKKEQKVLRREFVDSFKRNLRGQLDNISIQELDGSITNTHSLWKQERFIATWITVVKSVLAVS